MGRAWPHQLHLAVLEESTAVGLGWNLFTFGFGKKLEHSILYDMAHLIFETWLPNLENRKTGK